MKTKRFSMRFEANVISVGGTLYMQIPKTLAENYQIKKGSVLVIHASADGLYLSVKQTKVRRGRKKK